MTDLKQHQKRFTTYLYKNKFGQHNTTTCQKTILWGKTEMSILM